MCVPLLVSHMFSLSHSQTPATHGEGAGGASEEWRGGEGELVCEGGRQGGREG